MTVRQEQIRRRLGPSRRRMLKSPGGRWLLRQPPIRWALDRRRHRVTRQLARRDADRVAEVTTCCIFIGHVKSGGSLLGAMLDAHPEIALADEIDVMAQLAAGLNREQIFQLLVRGAGREARNGRVTARRLEPYSLAIPGQWQGRETTLRAVGDSRAGPTTRVLGSDPAALDRLVTALAPTRVAFVHVIRNPYESISAMVRRSGRSVADAVADHRAQCMRLIDLRERLSPADLYTLRYEELVAKPGQHLREALEFLAVESRREHIAACEALVAPVPVRERDQVVWTPDDHVAVEQTIRDVGFLAGYGFDR